MGLREESEMKRTWKVYKRGDTYRVARPGWLFWHWYTEFQSFDLWEGVAPVQFRSQDVAARWADHLNNELAKKMEYRKDAWHEAK